MKSKVICLSHKERLAYFIIRKDDNILKSIEKVFQEFNPNFNLDSYKTRFSKESRIFWESTQGIVFRIKQNEEVFKFKLKGESSFINEFIKILLDKYAEFVKPNVFDIKR